MQVLLEQQRVHPRADTLREASYREQSEEVRQIGERQQDDETDAEPNEKAVGRLDRERPAAAKRESRYGR